MKNIRELSQSLRDRDSISGAQTLVEAVGTKRVLVEHHKGIVSYGDQEIRVQTLVEAVGTKRVLVEHHKGIVSYGDQEIRVASTYGVVCVQGEGLRLCCMNREQVFLSGQIKSISMEREKP